MSPDWPALRPQPTARLGIIGGGQLARMMIPAATRLGCEVVVLDPTPASPAGQLAAEQIVGAFDDPAALRGLVERCDVTTFDIETIDAEALGALAAEGHRILPDPGLLATIQDKLLQKQALTDAGLPTSGFEAMDEPTPEALLRFGLPLVQKARRGGYDGRGVAVFTDAVISERILPVPSMVERFVDFRCELAVVVARSADGSTEAYPLVEMVFDPGTNVLDMLLAPARVEPDIAERALAIATDAITALDGVGVFGVELFLTTDGQVLINEIAPRTHNSGHWTQDACATCQFEQHVRAVLGLPLGSPRQHSPAVMINLLGEPDAHGQPVLDGLDEALATPGVHVHLYGKHEVRPHRKMGHLTVTAASLDEAMSVAQTMRERVRIRGDMPQQQEAGA